MQAKDMEDKAAPAVDADKETGGCTGAGLQGGPGDALAEAQPAVSPAAGADASTGPQPAVGPSSGNGMHHEGVRGEKRNVRKRVVEAGSS